MSEKRKPAKKIIAEFRGKRVRVELFPAMLWPKAFWKRRRDWTRNRYRVRVNGKWSQGESAFTLSEVLRQIRKLMLNSK